MSTRTQCDRCGKTISYPDSVWLVSITEQPIYTPPDRSHPRDRRVEFCGACVAAAVHLEALPRVHITLDRTPVKAIVMRNEMVAVFDAQGNQVPEYQGYLSEVGERLAAVLPRDRWDYGDR